MGIIGGSVDPFRLGHEIRAPHVGDFQRCQQHAFRIPQGNGLASPETLGERLADIQCDGHRPQDAAGEPHRIAHRVVVRPVEEAFQWREGAVHEQVQVADLSLGQIPGLVVLGFDLLLVTATFGQIQILQRAAVWLFECSHCYLLSMLFCKHEPIALGTGPWLWPDTSGPVACHGATAPCTFE